MQSMAVFGPIHRFDEKHPSLFGWRMFAQSKTNRRDPSYWLALELRIRSAFRWLEDRFSLSFQSVKKQVLNGIEREPELEDVRPEEPYFWVESYNAVLLESDARQTPRRVQSALRAIEQRRGYLERNMNAGEWNLLHYAELVLSHMTGGTPLRSRPRQAATSSAPREKNAA